MSDLKRRTVADLVLAGLTAVGAAILLIGVKDLPPPRFEPLGSAALPRILGALLIVFALLIATRAILRYLKGQTTLPVAAPPAGPQADPRRGALVLGALIAYVFALDVLHFPFVIATVVFVTATGLSIGTRSLKNALVFATLGLGLALTISLVLERLLYVRIG